MSAPRQGGRRGVAISGPAEGIIAYIAKRVKEGEEESNDE